MVLPEKELNPTEIKSALPENSRTSLHQGPNASLPSASKSQQGKASYGTGTKAAGNKTNVLYASGAQNMPRKTVTAVTAENQSNAGKGRASTRTGAVGKQSVTSSLRAGKDKQIPESHPMTFPSGKSPASHPMLPTEDIDQVEKETRGQRDNLEWRKYRITASIAHQISHSKFANHKTDEIPQSYLKAVVGTGSRVQTTTMHWGIQNEKRAVLAYEKLASKRDGRQVKVEDCGLFIHPMKNWLAARPDGIVKDKCTGETLRILEVKCPYKHREHTIQEACADSKFCLQLNGNSYLLRKDHAYYTQVQCQLAATQLRNADFVVLTNKETAIVPVHFSPEFWECIEPKLERFYNEAVLPQLQKLSVNRKEVKKLAGGKARWDSER
ncbi:hypothetical protein XELAEV_18029552mg [Xenopus laevis]|uniref:YqaJ viral recombinase domain-containing protein n=1 Tax=Xenopus laevis TaxID=8355 RepID=A0A974HHV2_XENLA|nr:hypothetical protein XELAEV_18029552mg [Xenopus laevis]